MSFQIQLSPMRSAIQSVPVRMASVHARRAPRAPIQVQALGVTQSVPVIVEAMKIGFMYGALPGTIKGAWDIKRAMAEPQANKPLTFANKQVMLSHQAALYGASGALIGLCAGVFSTQFNLSPDDAWQAGTVWGLCLYAAMVALGKHISSSPVGHDAHRELGEQERCELPNNQDDKARSNPKDSI